MTHDVSHLAGSNAKEWSFLEQIQAKVHAGHGRVDAERATITISREFGAGGHTLAQKVGEELGDDWQVWDRQIVDEIAKHANVRTQLAEMLDEKTHSSVEQMFRYLTNYWGLSPDRYHTHLIEVLLNASHQGRKIIIGRGANFILPRALKVRLRASEEFRVKAISLRESISEEAAKNKIKSVDKERGEFIKTMFRRDINDDNFYDITLQTDHLTTVEASAAISSAAIAHIHVPK